MDTIHTNGSLRFYGKKLYKDGKDSRRDLAGQIRRKEHYPYGMQVKRTHYGRLCRNLRLLKLLISHLEHGKQIEVPKYLRDTLKDLSDHVTRLETPNNYSSRSPQYGYIPNHGTNQRYE